MKEANLFGRKTVCRKWGGEENIPQTLMLFPDRVFSMTKPVGRMSVCPKILLRRLRNRLQQNGKSFGAEFTGGSG
jgi:hypothetical protein